MVKLIGGVTFLYYAADGLQPTYLNKSLMCEPIRNPLGKDIRGGTRSKKQLQIRKFDTAHSAMGTGPAFYGIAAAAAVGAAWWTEYRFTSNGR